MAQSPSPSVEKLMSHEMDRQLANFKLFEADEGDVSVDLPKKDELCAQFIKAKAEDESYALSQGLRKIRFGINLLPPLYPPCTKSLKDLKEINIDDLKLEIHHIGYFIMLRCCTAAYRSVSKVAIVVVVEDNEGAVLVLETYNQGCEEVISANQILDKNTILIVKEPYFRRSTYDESLVIRVDHVTDMVVWKGESWKVPDGWVQERSIQHWMDDGKQALKDGKVWRAVHCFDIALNQCKLDDTQQTQIKNERGLAYILTGQLENALDDLLDCQARTTQSYQNMSTKSLTATCKAFYHLGRFKELHQTLLDHRQQLQSPECTQEYIDKVWQRKMEQESGSYNFSKMQEDATKQPPILDYATFIGSIEKRSSPGRGTGMFATKNIQVGDLLVCEKAFAHCFVSSAEQLTESVEIRRQGSVEYHPSHIYYDCGERTCLMNTVMHRISKSPGMREAFMSLHHQEKSGEATFEEIDGITPIDTYLVMNKIETNRFMGETTKTMLLESLTRQFKPRSKKTRQEDDNGSSGIYITTSYFNHSCFPSASWSMIGDMILIRATRDIPKDEEITISYANRANIPASEQRNPQAAQQHILNNWGFTCDCVMCKNDEKRTQEMVDLARTLKSEVGILEGNYKGLEERLMRWENECFDPYGDVPRQELAARWTRLARGYSEYGLPADACRAVENAFRLLAFEIQGVGLADEKDLVVRRWGLVYKFSPECWCILWTCFAKNGNLEKAEKCREYAMLCYKIWVGEDESFEELYGRSVRSYVREGDLWAGYKP